MTMIVYSSSGMLSTIYVFKNYAHMMENREEIIINDTTKSFEVDGDYEELSNDVQRVMGLVQLAQYEGVKM